MVRNTIIVRFSEGTTMIIPDEVWDVIGEDVQNMIEWACEAIEKYHEDKTKSKRDNE